MAASAWRKVQPSGSVSGMQDDVARHELIEQHRRRRPRLEAVFAGLEARRKALAIRVAQPAPRAFHEPRLLEPPGNGRERCAARHLENGGLDESGDRPLQPLSLVVIPDEKDGDRDEREQRRRLQPAVHWRASQALNASAAGAIGQRPAVERCDRPGADQRVRQDAGTWQQ